MEKPDNSYSEPPPTTVLSGIPANYSIPPSVTGRSKSSGPKIFGIIAILIAFFGILSGLYSLLTIQESIDQYESIFELNTLATFWIYFSPILTLISSIIFGYAGLQLYNYQKKSIIFGMISIGVNFLSSVIGTILLADSTKSIDSDLAVFVGGAGIIGSITCHICCGIIILLPLLFNGEDLE